MKLKIFISKKLWYFNITARNGKIVAASEGYHRRGMLLKTLQRLLDDRDALAQQLDDIIAQGNY